VLGLRRLHLPNRQGEVSVEHFLPNYPTGWAAMKAAAARLGIGAAETVRIWVRKASVDAGQRHRYGVRGGRGDHAAASRKRRAVAGERDPQGDLGLLRSRAGTAAEALVGFLAAHREVFGVEPICRAWASHGLKLTMSTYYAVKSRRPAPGRSVTLG
jgi:transposase-like protein